MLKKVFFILLAIAAIVPFAGQLIAATQVSTVKTDEVAWYGGHGWGGHGWGGWRGGGYWGGYPWYGGSNYYPYHYYYPYNNYPYHYNYYTW